MAMLELLVISMHLCQSSKLTGKQWEWDSKTASNMAAEMNNRMNAKVMAASGCFRSQHYHPGARTGLLIN